MSTVKIRAEVISQEKLASDVYSLVLCIPEIAESAKAGQFVSVYSKDGARLLPRPISLCEADRENGTIRLVYRVVGVGTEEFSHLVVGETVDILGPLGNGFSKRDKRAILIGGGIGIPPMLQLAKELQGEKSIVVGFRNETFLLEDLEQHGKVFVASEDGKNGIKGNVLDAMRANEIAGDVIYACGPAPMLRAIKDYALEKGIEAQLPLEERMACGIGACLACVCQSKEVDAHSHVHNKRICKDGPVFDAQEVEL